MPARGEIPDWAKRERARDLRWIQENLHVLWLAARQGFEQSGRGAVVTDTTIAPVKHQGGEGHPMYYLPAEQIEQQRWEEVKRLVRGYDPTWEFVAVFLKPGRESAYRIGVPAAKSQRR